MVVRVTWVCGVVVRVTWVCGVRVRVTWVCGVGDVDVQGEAVLGLPGQPHPAGSFQMLHVPCGKSKKWVVLKKQKNKTKTLRQYNRSNERNV